MAGVTERVIQANPIGAAGGRVLVSPFQFTLDEDDNLRVVVANSAAGVALTIQGWRVDSVGVRHPISETITPATDRSKTTKDFTLGAGALQFLTVFAGAGTPGIGQTYVLVQLIRGSSGAKLVMGTLLAGYVTATQALGWPGSPIQNSFDGRGFIREVVGTAVVPGSELSETVPTNTRWRLQSFSTIFALSGAAGGRYPVLIISRSGVFFVTVPILAAGPAAGSTNTFTWAPGLAFFNLILPPSFYVGGLPLETILDEGDRLLTSTTGLLAGDAYTAPLYAVEEWIKV